MKKPCEMGKIFHKAFFMQRKLRGATGRLAPLEGVGRNEVRPRGRLSPPSYKLLFFFTKHYVCKDTEDKCTGNCTDFYGAETYYHSANTCDKNN